MAVIPVKRLHDKKNSHSIATTANTNRTTGENSIWSCSASQYAQMNSDLILSVTSQTDLGLSQIYGFLNFLTYFVRSWGK